MSLVHWDLCIILLHTVLYYGNVNSNWRGAATEGDCLPERPAAAVRLTGGEQLGILEFPGLELGRSGPFRVCECIQYIIDTIWYLPFIWSTRYILCIMHTFHTAYTINIHSMIYDHLYYYIMLCFSELCHIYSATRMGGRPWCSSSTSSFGSLSRCPSAAPWLRPTLAHQYWFEHF